MAEKIQDKFNALLEQVSEQEKIRNTKLIRETRRVLVALEYLKAELRPRKKRV
jgi:hypothetical protein